MAALEFSREEVENLARKLDSVQAQLSEGERTLLVAIFAAAGEHVDVVVRSADTELRTADLVDQIVKAFIPGHDQLYVLPSRVGYTNKPTPTPSPTPDPPKPKDAPPAQS